MAPFGCFDLFRLGQVTFPAPGGRHMTPVFAVSSENAVKTCEIHSRPGRQRGQIKVSESALSILAVTTMNMIRFHAVQAGRRLQRCSIFFAKPIGPRIKQHTMGEMRAKFRPFYVVL